MRVAFLGHVYGCVHHAAAVVRKPGCRSGCSGQLTWVPIRSKAMRTAGLGGGPPAPCRCRRAANSCGEVVAFEPTKLAHRSSSDPDRGSRSAVGPRDRAGPPGAEDDRGRGEPGDRRSDPVEGSGATRTTGCDDSARAVVPVANVAATDDHAHHRRHVGRREPRQRLYAVLFVPIWPGCPAWRCPGEGDVGKSPSPLPSRSAVIRTLGALVAAELDTPGRDM